MNVVPQSDDPRRASRLRLLTGAIAILFPAAVLIALAIGVTAMASGLSSEIRVSPVVAISLYILVFIVGIGCITLGAILAAWISLKRFTRAEARSEFLWVMWLPKTSSLSSKLFDKLFPLSSDTLESSNTSLERTRER